MDPFTIATIVVKLTATCLSTGKALYDIRKKYIDSPLSIVTIGSEMNLISACLSHLQMILCRKENFVQELDSRPEIAHTLDGALTGCMVLFSCLEEEIRNITGRSTQSGDLSWKGKAKSVWNHEKIQDLLAGLRGQQAAINVLIQLVQLDSLGEIKQLLVQNRPVLAESIRRTESLKQSHPHVVHPASVFSIADRESIYSNAHSIAGASELEFEFDDLIVNSKAYRRVLASAKRGVPKTDRQGIEGDLIDLSDSQTVVAVPIDGAARDMDCLITSENQGIAVLSKPSKFHKVKNPPPLRLSELPEETGNEITYALNTLGLSSELRETTPARTIHGIASTKPMNGKDHEISPNSQENLDKANKTPQFGGYVLITTLHKCAQSKVKLGRTKEDGVGGRKFVIKIMTRPSPGTHSKMLEAIYREVAILRELQHPNIVRLKEVVDTEKRIGIVLEYVSGGTLFGYIESLRYLKDNDARRIFAQIISGVGYLHMKGIMHRKLTLESVLLDRNHNVRISGFTSASAFDPTDGLGEDIEYNLSSQEFVNRMELDHILPSGHRRGDLMQTTCGKTVYSAPEILRGESLYRGRKADIWSCGVILYAMLAGHLPFDDDPANPDGDNVRLLIKFVCETPLRFPNCVTPQARDLLRRIIVTDPCQRANIVEVEKHSWLSEYKHVVGFPYVQRGEVLNHHPNDVVPGTAPPLMTEEKMPSPSGGLDHRFAAFIVIENIPFGLKINELLAIIAKMELPQPRGLKYYTSDDFRSLVVASFNRTEEAAQVINSMNNVDIQGQKLRVRKPANVGDVFRKAEREAPSGQPPGIAIEQ